MVSHRIRSLSIEGMEPPYISSWACAFNKAFPLKPVGAIATLFGAAGVENRSRELRRIGNFTTDTYGTPFIADAVRRLSLKSRYAILPPRIDLPYVGSGVLGSALAMDKHVAKTVLADAGIAVAPWRTVTAHEISRNPGIASSLDEGLH